MDWHPVRTIGCVVHVLLKLLHTTETTDKLMAYGPPQLLKGLLGVAVACMLNYFCNISLSHTLSIYIWFLIEMCVANGVLCNYFSGNPCRIINKIMKNAWTSGEAIALHNNMRWRYCDLRLVWWLNACFLVAIRGSELKLSVDDSSILEGKHLICK